jgi:effector-binding domain-containing protein
MPAGNVVLKQVAAVRVAELTATAASYDRRDIGPAVRPLYPELLRRLDDAGVQPAGGPGIIYYEDPAEPSDAVIVHAAIPVTAARHPGYDFAVVDLPAIRLAATIIHRGPMDEVLQTLWMLAGWIEDNGYRPAGYHREVRLDCHPDQGAAGVTELQVAVAGDLTGAYGELSPRPDRMRAMCRSRP